MNRTALTTIRGAPPLIAALLLAPAPATAFGTINIAGQAFEHEKITRMALATAGFEPASLDEIAGKSLTWGAVGSPDNPARGLILSDYAHCDNGDHLDVPGYPKTRQEAMESLDACRRWIFSNLDAAVDRAGALLDGDGRIDDSQIPTRISCTFLGQSGRAKCDVIEALGVAMHAAQDFYSHTNWTDETTQRPPTIAHPPGLGAVGRAPFLDPRLGVVDFPAGLMSGCFGIPESLACAGHVQHEVLNKDKGEIDPARGVIGKGSTTRAAGNDNFRRAVGAAVRDTRDKWFYFRQRVEARYGPERGPRIVCAILHDDPARTCH